MHVATPKAINAGYVPIHWKPCARASCPERLAMLINKSGTNTLKPHAALRPIPRQILNTVSIELLASLHLTRNQINQKLSQKG